VNVGGPRGATGPSGRAATATESFAAALAAEPRLASLPPLAGSAGDPPRLDAPATIHRVALAIELVRAGERGRVELRLEGGVALQLDASTEGVSLTLTVPSPSAFASAELPGLVAALRQRRVRVAGAQVRVAGRRGPGERPR
jgi:hypothetical protein